MYYFDHSATTPLFPEVTKLMNTLNENIYGNPSSIYSAGRKSRSIIEEARNQIAQSISSKPEQIIFTSGGTEANNQVLWSIVNESKKHIISNRIEHPAVTKVLKYLKSFGINYELVEVKKDGIVCVDTIIAAIKSNTSLISLMLANNELGTIQPLKEVVEYANKNNIMVHTDAVQCLGKMNVDVTSLGIDFLSLSAHKFYGPKGIGALYVKNPKKINALIIGGSQEKDLRAGTENISAIAGMGLAAELSTTSLNQKIKSLQTLETQFKDGLNDFFNNAVFNGNQFKKLPGIVNVSFPNFRSDKMMIQLDRKNIAVSNGSACGSGSIKPSKVLSAIGLNENINLSTLRISFGKSNNKEQVEYLLNSLKSILIN